MFAELAERRQLTDAAGHIRVIGQMSQGMLLFLLLLLSTRAFFYYMPLRRPLGAYGAKTAVDLGVYFLLFEVNVISGTTIPGVLLLINVLTWVYESILFPAKDQRRAQRISAEIVPGLILIVAAIVVVFASQNAPPLRSFAAKVAEKIGRKELPRLVVAFVALFELGHVVPELASSPARLIIYGLRVQGAFLASAGLATAAVTLDTVVAIPAHRRSTAIRSAAAATLAVVFGGTANWLAGLL